MQTIGIHNDHLTYHLTVINIFLKYALVELVFKKINAKTKAFDNIFIIFSLC